MRYQQKDLRAKVVPICRCSFCGRGTDKAELLVEAERPGVYICDGCLADAVETAAGHAPRFARKLTEAARGKA
jgi:ribosome-binding protein aMBF1 (putative translation factor)